jgi:SAM-dependent MidA family methyltransferase
MFCFKKKVGRLAEQLEKMWMEIEGPEKQKMAEIGKQNGKYALLFMKG